MANNVWLKHRIHAKQGIDSEFMQLLLDYKIIKMVDSYEKCLYIYNQAKDNAIILHTINFINILYRQQYANLS